MPEEQKPKQPKKFPWTSIGSENALLERSNFYGKMVLQYEDGNIILLRFEQTKKP